MHTDMESILDSAQGGGSINNSINGTTERDGISGDHNHSHDHPMPHIPRLRSQLVVQMSGAPGAGKSTIGNLLAKTIGAVLIDHDVLRSFFLDIGEDFDVAAEHAYRLQWVLTEFYLKKKRSVVVDSTCNYQVTLDTGSNLAQRYACKYRYVECRLGDINVLENRLKSRDSLRSQRKSIYSDPVDFQKLNVPGLKRDAAATFQTWIDSPCRPNHGVIVIHTTNDPATCLQDLLKQIDVDVRTEDRINEKGACADIDNDSRLNVSHLDGAQPNSPLSSNGVQGTEHLQQLAGSVNPVVLVTAPTFPSDKPVPQIYPSGHGDVEEYSSVNSILRNDHDQNVPVPPVRQRYVIRGANEKRSHRSNLQRRVSIALDLDDATTSVICVTSGTNALRAALKAVFGDDRVENRDEIIVPALTAVSTAEAVIMEGFVPVIVDIDALSWTLDPHATAQAITERTAAIITVDWLGTQCDLHPFRKMADAHGLKLVSDSAQSFGSGNGRPPAVDLADIMIYSTGFPKVLQTGGAGGIVICSRSQAAWLNEEPSGILRHELMFEINAYLGLRALDRFSRDLAARRTGAETYRSLLRNVPGIVFQHFSSNTKTNHYQISFTVDTEKFGMDAKGLCRALQAENVMCSLDRMRCLGNISRLLRHGRTQGDLAVSRKIDANSITLPIFDQLTPEVCRNICACIAAIHQQSQSTTPVQLPVKKPKQRSRQLDIDDIADKLRSHWILPIIDGKDVASGSAGSHPWTALVPWQSLFERKVSIDEIHRCLASRQTWVAGDTVLGDLVVQAKIGNTGLVLNPRGGNGRFSLSESGSSATVSLVLSPDGKVEVLKSCSHDGIAGNGRPWLEKQSAFLKASSAVKETRLFVTPSWTKTVNGATWVCLPYIPSLSLAAMAFAGMGADSLLGVFSNLFEEMAVRVWPKGQVAYSGDYIGQVHFDRIKRSIAIARAADPELDCIAASDSVTVNGRELRGLDRVVAALRQHPVIKSIAPKLLGEIHGDLNIHNILCDMDPESDRPLALVDPRGVNLLKDFDQNAPIEAGDYSYDISKAKSSLSGFSEIRKGFYTLERESNSFTLKIKDHPGSLTLQGANRDLFTKLSSSAQFMKYVEAVEPLGFRSLELRILLGEAAHFVADCACALGRHAEHEVVPLFLMGLAKLNEILDVLEGPGDALESVSAKSIDFQNEAKALNFGALRSQSTILQDAQEPGTWDVMEIVVKSEAIFVGHQLSKEIVGEFLPSGTQVYVSTHPVEQILFPCVIIHPFVGNRGQTESVFSAMRRTRYFLQDNGVMLDKIDNLRIVTVGSTGNSSRCQMVSRFNDKLMAPGPFGLSPLRMKAIEANFFEFQGPGRWIVENDSFFVPSSPIRPKGDCITLLTANRKTTRSNSAARWHINATNEHNGRTFAAGFENIGPDELDDMLLRPTSAIFIPARLTDYLASMMDHTTGRQSSILVDLIFPRFMQKKEWIALSHMLGYGVKSDMIWNLCKRLEAQDPRIELAYGGDDMVFYHLGTDAMFAKSMASVPTDPILSSLANLPATAKWLRHYKKRFMAAET